MTFIAYNDKIGLHHVRAASLFSIARVSMKILICDDEQTYLNTLHIHVEEYMLNHHIPCTVTALTDPTKVAIDTAVFDLAFLDIQMPGVDGIALAKHLRQNNPKMLMINKAIAEATEENHKISTLRANGLLDADACAVRMNAISAKLTQLRGERRWLSENEVLDEAMDAIRKMTAVIKNGPEQMNIFDEDLFDSLVEKVIAESQTRIRFRLCGGLELAEQLEVAAR